MARPLKNSSQKSSKDKLLSAAFSLIRSKGYGSTSVDLLCEEAGVTKGTFFHYFKTKEDLAVAAAHHWSMVTDEVFKKAPYHSQKDPLQRLFGYIKFRKDILRGQLPEFTCLVGTMVQEVFDTNPEIRKACKESIFGHATRNLQKDIEDSLKLYAPKAKYSAESLALHTQAVIQGAFILAKASDDAQVAIQSLDHLKNYFEFIFSRKT